MKEIVSILLRNISPILITIFWGDVWRLKKSFKRKPSSIKSGVYYAYMSLYGASFGIESETESTPIFPHGLFGIFVSDGSIIGNNVVIFQQVTIGSNTLKDSKTFGSPTIGNNVYIGAGAKIIGGITVGNNVRVGANAIVIEDVPDNSIVVIDKIRVITKSEPLDNKFTTRFEAMDL